MYTRKRIFRTLTLFQGGLGYNDSKKYFIEYDYKISDYLGL